jgi:hypothetical protein
MNAHIDAIAAEIKKRAAKYCQDNPRTCRGRETEIETTMLIGASIVFETEANLSEAELGNDTLMKELFRCPCGEDH